MLKNGLYNVLAALIRTGLGVLVIPVLIRFLGVEGYGLWTLVSAFIGIAGLAEAGLSVSTTVFLSRDLANDDAIGISQTLTAVFGTMLLLATTAAVALWLGASRLVSFFSLMDQSQYLDAVQAIKIGGLVVWAQLLQRVLVGIEQAYQKYGVMNVINTLQVILINLGMLFVAWSGGKTTELVEWQLVTCMGILAAHGWIAWQLVYKAKIHLIWDARRGIAVAKYSLMTWLTSLGTVLFGQADRLVVGTLLGAEKLGVYAAITNVTRQINTFSALPVQPLLPTLSRAIEQQKSGFNQTNLKNQVKQAIQVNTSIALGLGIVLLTFAPPIMIAMIPDTTGDYVWEFSAAVIIYALYSTNAVGYYTLFSTNSVNLCVPIVLASGCISLIMIIIGTLNLGLMGSILGNIGYLISLLLTLFGLRNLNISNFDYINYIKLPIVIFGLFIAVKTICL